MTHPGTYPDPTDPGMTHPGTYPRIQGSRVLPSLVCLGIPTHSTAILWHTPLGYLLYPAGTQHHVTTPLRILRNDVYSDPPCGTMSQRGDITTYPRIQGSRVLPSLVCLGIPTHSTAILWHTPLGYLLYPAGTQHHVTTPLRILRNKVTRHNTSVGLDPER